MTQEFHLSITSLGSDRYLIRTEDAAAGVPVAEAQVDWPVEEWLKLSQPAMNDPLSGLLQGNVDLSDSGLGLHKLGSKLHTALFQDDSIRESWLRAQGIALNRQEILRFRLGLKESRLQRLPWEVLQQGGQPMTTRPDMTFVRYAANLLVGQTQAQQLPDAGSSIQVLLVVASPRDQDHLKLVQEVRHIQELFAVEQDKSLSIQIDVLEQPDRSQLAQKLEQGNYQVLHYAGHSDFGKNGGDLSLVNRQTGLTERLSGDDLAGLLVNNHVVLTVFNSCRSGHTAGDDAEMDWRQQNLVQALVSRGVPSVIAMAERIPDEVAIAFTRLFYHNLREGFPIDVSLSRTRQGLISGYGSDQNYWALPILYLQPDFDGYLTKRDREADDQLSPNTIERTQSSPLAVPEPLSDDRPTALAAPKQSSLLPREVSEDITDPLLTQLDQTENLQQEEDDVLADYVQQLSSGSSTTDEPMMPADQQEILIDEAVQRSGMDIYDVLPEVSVPKTETTDSVAAPLPLYQKPAAESDLDTSDSPPELSPPQVATTPEAAATSTKASDKRIMMWLVVGAIGVIGMVSMGALAIYWAGGRTTSSPVVTTPDASEQELDSESFDADTLVRQGEIAIAQERYADAREKFDQALTQALMGNADASISDDIWNSVADATDPDLLYIQGRLAWQEATTLASDIPDVNDRFEQRQQQQNARAAWAQTDELFLEGRIARGFAAYAAGDWDDAIDNWEAAIRLYDEERQRQPNPASPTPLDSVILHAYAGLVMAYTESGNLNLAGREEDPGLRTASADEVAILNAESDNALASAREYFLLLQERDAREQMVPSELVEMNESPHTWDNWLWTQDLIEEWRVDYRHWDQETNENS
ncbi:CHAT domain-containing protein [Oscillatoria sp. CS-180]|uniref:CHAT domain-containing protein n=1 Tax=Oscillatoria sp. CS-180 TaxID=3021720 RepID=UPI00232F80D6|nr:CHAT domain-containing protein [Oscillatoria sp. CS-180]MDB9525955.1 CHAT domain-containing protein [Oscillatoria sp. CS-180]